MLCLTVRCDLAVVMNCGMLCSSAVGLDTVAVLLAVTVRSDVSCLVCSVALHKMLFSPAGGLLCSRSWLRVMALVGDWRPIKKILHPIPVACGLISVVAAGLCS